MLNHHQTTIWENVVYFSKHLEQIQVLKHLNGIDAPVKVHVSLEILISNGQSYICISVVMNKWVCGMSVVMSIWVSGMSRFWILDEDHMSIRKPNMVIYGWIYHDTSMICLYSKEICVQPENVSSLFDSLCSVSTQTLCCWLSCG